MPNSHSRHPSSPKIGHSQEATPNTPRINPATKPRCVQHHHGSRGRSHGGVKAEGRSRSLKVTPRHQQHSLPDTEPGGSPHPDPPRLHKPPREATRPSGTQGNPPGIKSKLLTFQGLADACTHAGTQRKTGFQARRKLFYPEKKNKQPPPLPVSMQELPGKVRHGWNANMGTQPCRWPPPPRSCLGLSGWEGDLARWESGRGPLTCHSCSDKLGLPL